MPNFFMALYQNDVVQEDAFHTWREDKTNATPGKDKALTQVEKFFDYLQQEEEEEEGASRRARSLVLLPPARAHARGSCPCLRRHLALLTAAPPPPPPTSRRRGRGRAQGRAAPQ